MNILEAILLGVVQGITEWLPISSSGHLVIFERIFGVNPPLSFNILLHLGSLLVVLIVFRNDIVKLLRGLGEMDPYSWKFASMLVVASIPIGLVGIFLKSHIEAAFESTFTVGVGLLLTTLFLYYSHYPQTKKKKLTLGRAIIIGCGQAFAIFPGVSRSGSTISTGMMLGIKKADVALFSFLLFIPAILGATALEMRAMQTVLDPASIAGFFATVISGWLSLRWLLYIIKKGNFRNFFWYTGALGIIVLIVSFLG